MSEDSFVCLSCMQPYPLNDDYFLSYGGIRDKLCIKCRLQKMGKKRRLGGNTKECLSRENCVHPSGPQLPANTKYFHRHSRTFDNLFPRCKYCMAHYRGTTIKHPKHDIPDGYKRCSRGDKCIHPDGPILPATNEYYWKSGYGGKFQSWCIVCASNRDKARSKTPYAKKLAKINRARRSARKIGLPDTFTINDWNEGCKYFNNCCAACGARDSDELVIAADHWIPINDPDCPGTIPTNIVPLCHGKTGCNNSKRDSDPNKWLIRKFGRIRAAEIAQKIEDYFQFVNQRRS